MSQIGSVYGGALYSLCKEEDLCTSVLQQIRVLEQSFADTPEYLRLLCAPNIPVQERCQILDECFRDQVHGYVLNFLKILTEKGLARQFGACVSAYTELYNQDHNIYFLPY